MFPLNSDALKTEVADVTNSAAVFVAEEVFSKLSILVSMIALNIEYFGASVMVNILRHLFVGIMKC